MSEQYLAESAVRFSMSRVGADFVGACRCTPVLAGSWACIYTPLRVAIYRIRLQTCHPSVVNPLTAPSIVTTARAPEGIGCGSTGRSPRRWYWTDEHGRRSIRERNSLFRRLLP